MAKTRNPLTWLVEHDWCQGMTLGVDGKVCLAGAMECAGMYNTSWYHPSLTEWALVTSKILHDYPFRVPAAMHVSYEQYPSEENCRSIITRFNDHHQTTKADVIRVLTLVYG